MRHKKIVILISICLILLLGCSDKVDDNTIVISDGLYAEVSISAYMAKYLIEEHTDYKAIVKGPMANTLAFQEMQSEGIDILPTYDGSLLSTYLLLDPGDVPENMTVYEYANLKGSEKFGVRLLDKFGHQNTYVVAVRPEIYEKYGVEKVSDLVDIAPKLVFAAEHGFFDDRGAVRYHPFTEFYGLNFKEGHSIDIGLKYAGLDSGHMDVTLVYTSDGLNKKYDVKLLEDDRGFFPEYYKAYLVRDDFEEKYPGATEALNLLSGLFNEELFMKLNYEVDVNARRPQSVAKEFLREQGLVK